MFEWQKYFKAPFSHDPMVPGIVWDSNGVTVITPSCDEVSSDEYIGHMESLVDVMNGNPPRNAVTFDNPRYTGSVLDAQIRFSVNGAELCLDIRGWGHLTGGMKLDNKVAAGIQDSLGEFVVECMKKANKASKEKQ